MIYRLSDVRATEEGYGFAIVGGIGKPLVQFAFEHESDAKEAAEQMQAAIAKAKLVGICSSR